MQPWVVAVALALSPNELKGAVSDLKVAVSGLKSDVAEIKEALDMPQAAEGKCECISLPDAINRTEKKEVETESGTMLPEAYGGQCAQHDLTTAACSGEYKASYCYESWCYVDKDCAEKDTKSSFFFGKKTELYYSYQNCGGLDAFAAEACGAEDTEETCDGLSESCAWNKGSKVCQNKLCQCTGSSEGIDDGFAEGYGESCQAWDESSCDDWTDKGDGHELGLWCCKSFCYVEEGCPSGKASESAPGLFYSYHACPDSADALAQCKWDEPINFDGSPVALSSAAAKSLNDAATKQGFLRRMRKHHRAPAGKNR